MWGGQLQTSGTKASVDVFLASHAERSPKGPSPAAVLKVRSQDPPTQVQPSHKNEWHLEGFRMVPNYHYAILCPCHNIVLLFSDYGR